MEAGTPRYSVPRDTFVARLYENIEDGSSKSSRDWLDRPDKLQYIITTYSRGLLSFTRQQQHSFFVESSFRSNYLLEKFEKRRARRQLRRPRNMFFVVFWSASRSLSPALSAMMKEQKTTAHAHNDVALSWPARKCLYGAFSLISGSGVTQVVGSLRW